MSDRRDRLKGGLASVFGGLEKKREDLPDAGLDEPAAGQVETAAVVADRRAELPPSALEPAAQYFVPDVEEIAQQKPEPAPAIQTIKRQQAVLETAPEQKKPVREVPLAEPPPTAPSAPEQADLYAHVRRVKWPLLKAGDPYLLPGPDGFDNLNATINFRLPVDLDMTLDAHCRSVGAKKSEWLRMAILKLLADEQEVLREK